MIDPGGPSEMPGIAALRAISLGAYLRNVEQNDCKKIYCAKTPS